MRYILLPFGGARLPGGGNKTSGEGRALVQVCLLGLTNSINKLVSTGDAPPADADRDALVTRQHGLAGVRSSTGGASTITVKSAPGAVSGASN